MIPSNPHVLFIANAGPGVGGGHVMRSLTLAEALTARGAVCAFATTPEVGAILDAFAPQMAREPALALSAEALVSTVSAAKFDAIVFDHYGLDRGHHLSLADGKPSLVIDDLADRPLGGDIVLDSGPNRNLLDYTLLVDGKARLLLGPEYAPVRPAFASFRSETLSRQSPTVGRILVTMGLSDQAALTEKIVDLLRARLGQTALDVVVGEHDTGLRNLTRISSRDPRMTVHVNTPHMAELMAGCDLMICAAGSTIWEGCTLGRPMILLVVADNQRPAAQALAARDAAIVFEATAGGLEAGLDRAIVRLMSDAGLRARLGAAAAQVCDGGGAALAADALLSIGTTP